MGHGKAVNPVGEFFLSSAAVSLISLAAGNDGHGSALAGCAAGLGPGGIASAVGNHANGFWRLACRRTKSSRDRAPRF